MTSDIDDPFIHDLIEQFGGNGYMVYFGTISILCRETKKEIPENFTIPLSFLKRKFRISATKVEQILNFCSTNGKLSFQISNNFPAKVDFQFPKLIEIQDEWSKRLRSYSGVTPKKHVLEVEVEVDVDKNKETSLKEKNIKKEKTVLEHGDEIQDLDFIKKVLENLNAVAGKNYTHKTAETCKHIRARKNDGATLEDFYTVNRKKTAEWKGTDYEKFLRPSTLYLPSKFEGYRNAPEPRKTHLLLSHKLSHEEMCKLQRHNEMAEYNRVNFGL